MTTATGAYNVIRARLEANKPASLTGGFRYQGEDGEPLDDTPSPFAFVDFNTEPTSGPRAFGGGLARNLYRNPAHAEIFVFVPRGQGLTAATDLAETIAALFRSYRDADISCWSASVIPGGDGASIKPPGLNSEVGQYYFAVAEIDLHFDQIG